MYFYNNLPHLTVGLKVAVQLPRVKTHRVVTVENTHLLVGTTPPRVETTRHRVEGTLHTVTTRNPRDRIESMRQGVGTTLLILLHLRYMSYIY